jgi:hypothetical protein
MKILALFKVLGLNIFDSQTAKIIPGVPSMDIFFYLIKFIKLVITSTFKHGGVINDYRLLLRTVVLQPEVCVKLGF